MLAIESAFPQFMDIDGTPINNGQLYFGVVNLNPETNPITVYWDAAGTQPVSQPIQTINGYAVRNGSPASVFVNSDYSLNVRNGRGNLVFYAPTSNNPAIDGTVPTVANTAKTVDAITSVETTGLTDGAVIIAKGRSSAGDGGGGIFRYVAGSVQAADGGTVFTPSAGTGRLFRDGWTSVGFNAQVSVKFFGATGDGTTDDTSAIQSTINAVKDFGGGVVFFPEGTYKTTTSLTIPTQWPIIMQGVGIESTHINYTGADDAINARGVNSGDSVVKSGIADMRISGNGTTSVNGLDLYWGYAFFLRNVRLYNFTVGMRVEQSWSVFLDFVRIDSCSSNGLELHDEANNVVCVASEFLDNGNGVYTVGSRAIAFFGCTLEANTGYGAYITSNATEGPSENIMFSGCYIEGNTTGEIHITKESGSSPENVVVRDNYFVCIAGKASIAVRVVWGNGVLVDGNLFRAGSATYAYSLYTNDSATLSDITFGANRDTSTNGPYRGAGVYYRNQGNLLARAWGRFTVSGGAIATTNGFGVSSITYVGVGVYEITLLTPMPGTNYSIVASAENGAAHVAMLCSPGQPISTTVFRINTASSSAAAAEARTVSFSVYA